MQNNQFSYAKPRKLRMSVASNAIHVVAFTSVYTQAVILMSGHATADGFAAKLADLPKPGKFLREQLALAFAAQ